MAGLPPRSQPPITNPAQNLIVGQNYYIEYDQFKLSGTFVRISDIGALFRNIKYTAPASFARSYGSITPEFAFAPLRASFYGPSAAIQQPAEGGHRAFGNAGSRRRRASRRKTKRRISRRRRN